VAGQALLQGYSIDRKYLEAKIPITPSTNVDFQLFEMLRSRWEKFLPRRIALKSFALGVSKISPEFHQISFKEDSRESQLLSTLDRLRGKYGSSIIKIPKE